MFDVPGPTNREAQVESAVSLATLATILVEKGIFTMEEYERTKMRVSAEIDQCLAQREECAKAEFAEKYPALAKLQGWGL